MEQKEETQNLENQFSNIQIEESQANEVLN